MRRNMVWLMSLLFLGVFAIPLAADQPRLQTMPRIGFLADGSRSSTTAWIEGFRRGLRELGYEEGRSIAIEWLYGEGKTERFPALVTELTQRNVAVIVVGGATATRAAKQNGTPIPIVMVNVTDPVGLGLVASLARPGANITGVRPDHPVTTLNTRASERIVDFTVTHRMPAIFHARLCRSWRPHVLRGKRPRTLPARGNLRGQDSEGRSADLPVEQPLKFDVIVNLKTAKSLGLSIPQPLLVRADRVIE